MLNLAERVIEILIKEGVEQTLESKIDSESKRIPHIHSFPDSCCEVASFIFSKLLTDMMPNNDVNVVSGKCNNQIHYWILVNNRVFDLTHHQFSKNS